MKMLLDINFGWTSWQNFTVWFNSLSVVEQVMFIIPIVVFAVSLTILVCIGLYYLFKYIFLGIYYLLKGIFKALQFILTLLYKGLVSLYKLLFIRDNDSSVKCCQSEPITTESTMETKPIPKTLIEIPTKMDDSIENVEQSSFSFCSECGKKFTDKMHDHLKLNSRTYCVNCGQGFIVEQTSITQKLPKSYANYK